MPIRAPSHQTRWFRRLLLSCCLGGLWSCIRVGAEGADSRIHFVADSTPVTDSSPARSLLAAALVPRGTAAPEIPAADSVFDGALALAESGEFTGAAAAIHAGLPEDSASRSRAIELLTQFYVAQAKWSDVPARRPETDDGVSALLRAYAAAPPESLRFSAPVDSVPLGRSISGSPVVDVQLDGRRYEFWLDTGAGFTVLASDVARELGIEPLVSTGALGGTSTTKKVGALPAIVPSLRLGGLEVRNHAAVIVDAGDLELRLLKVFKVVDVDGIIGWNLIRQLDLELDVAGGVARIRRPGTGRTAERNLLWLGYPLVVAAGPAGERLLLGLDTGASSTYFTPEFVAATGVRAGEARTRTVGGAGGFEQVTVSTIASTGIFVDGKLLRVDGADVRAQRVSDLLRLHGVLGTDIAALGAMRIDATNGRLDLEVRPVNP